MRLPKIVLLLFCAAVNANLIAQKSTAAVPITDIDFIESKIKLAYAGFKDKITPAAFNKHVNAVKLSNEKDTFALLSKILLPFNDQHLALYQDRKNMEADSVTSREKYLYISKLRPKKNSFEGFWLNDLSTIVMYLKSAGHDAYEGYIVETENTTLLGYCIIKIQKQISGKRITDYTDIRGGFRMFTKSFFKNSQTLITGPFNKWHKIKNYKKNTLKNVLPFNTNAAVEIIDSNNVLIKMHDFSSKGITKKYDSLIRSNNKLIAGCKNLIIDIRYNAGGSIRNFIPLLPYICNQPIVRVGYYKLYSQDLIAEAESDRKIYLQQNDTSKVREYDTAIAKMYSNINQLIYNVADTLPCDAVTSKIINVGLIFNFGSRSAAELMILHLKQLKKVTTFGESTAGAVDYLDILRYKLPVSKYTFWVASTKRQTTNKEPMFDNGGIKPDVEITDETIDWVKFVKKYYE